MPGKKVKGGIGKEAGRIKKKKKKVGKLPLRWHTQAH